MNQIRSLVSTAPAELRERLRALSIKQTAFVCAVFRPAGDSLVETTTKLALHVLARRVLFLDAEVADLEAKAQADIAAAGDRSNDELRHEIVQLAGTAADRVAVETLDDATQQELIESFISRVGAGAQP